MFAKFHHWMLFDVVQVLRVAELFPGDEQANLLVLNAFSSADVEVCAFV